MPQSKKSEYSSDAGYCAAEYRAKEEPENLNLPPALFPVRSTHKPKVANKEWVEHREGLRSHWFGQQ